MKVLSDASIAKIDQFKPTELASTAWAFGKLCILDEPLMANIASKAVAKMSGFNDQAMSNTVWAFVTLSSPFDALMDKAAAEALLRAHALDSQNLSMIAWAFAEVKKSREPLFVAISLRAVVLLKSCAEESSMQEAYMPALSLAYAFTVLSAKPSGAADVPAAAAQCLQRHGARLDEKFKFNFAPVLGQHSMTEPAILRWQQGVCIVWKPPGWEVTVSDGEDQAVYSSGPQLQDWLGHRFPDCPIARDPVASYGLVHRLDRETSGMVMWAPTYQSYYALRLAFATERVQKEYLCLCDGWLPQEPRLLEGGIQRILPKEPGAGRHTSQVSSCGRRACLGTWR